MRLILHPGMHKTGTTSFQSYLSTHVDLFLECNILYPATGRGERASNQHALLPVSTLEMPHSFVGKPKESTSELLESLKHETRDSPCELAIISSEVFCELTQQRRTELVRDLAQIFDDVDVFITTREHGQAAWSGIQHQMRMNSCNPSVFSNVFFEYPKQYMKSIAYRQRQLAEWRELTMQILGKDVITADINESGGEDLCIFYLKSIPAVLDQLKRSGNLSRLPKSVRANSKEKAGIHEFGYLIALLTYQLSRNQAVVENRGLFSLFRLMQERYPAEMTNSVNVKSTHMLNLASQQGTKYQSSDYLEIKEMLAESGIDNSDIRVILSIAYGLQR